MNTISIKAVNPDNDRELRAIARLFRHVHGGSKLPPETYEVDFWKHHVGESFVSLAAFAGNTLVGHIAITRSRAITGCMELILPAFDVATLHDMYLIAESGNDQLCRLAARQGWNSLSCVPFVENVEFLPILTDVLGFSETALLPESAAENQSTCTSVWFKTVKACRSEIRPLYVHESLKPVFESLITDLQIPDRTLKTSTEPSIRPNLVIGSRQRLCTADVFVDAITSVRSNKNGCPIRLDKPGFFSVDLSNPESVVTTQVLVQRNFSLCGFIPNYYGADRALFMNFPLPESFPEERFSKSGKILSFFMRSAAEAIKKSPGSESYSGEFPYPLGEDIVTEEPSVM